MNMDINEIIHNIKPELYGYLHDTKNEDVCMLSIEKKIDRPFSTVAFFTVHTKTSNKYDFVLKIIRHNSINKKITEKENQATVEYNILKKLFPKFASVKGCSVPEPVLVKPKFELYVMHFVKGTLLMDNFKYTRILSPRKKFHTLKKNMYQCGQWLRYFQKFTGQEYKESNKAFESVLERAEDRLNLIDNIKSEYIPIDFKKTTMHFFEEQRKKIKDSKILVSGRHGDFSPLNMISDPKGLTVIDFLGYQKDPLPVDILKILIFLEDERMAFTSSSKRVLCLEKAFLSGYSDKVQASKQEILICEGMQRIVSIYGHLSHKNQLFHHRREAIKIINNHISWFMNQKTPVG